MPRTPLKKQPAVGSHGMVVTNHPLASAAGTQMLAAGGNAVDAAVSSLFALCVVEPMMVGVFGAGWTLAHLGDGRTLSIDGYADAPGNATDTMYRPVSDEWPDYLQAEGRHNVVGYRAVAVPGSLKAWTELLDREGLMSLPDVMEPAIRYARNGFAVSPYLHSQIQQHGADLLADSVAAATFLPDGQPLDVGERLYQPDLAESLGTIARQGADTLYGGELGRIVIDEIQRRDGILTMLDLTGYSTSWSSPLTGTYRGYRVLTPPPPSSGGVHLLQLLKILEGFDLSRYEFASPDVVHLLAEALEIAFADRFAHFGDPANTSIPVDWLISDRYGTERRSGIRMDRRGRHGAGTPPSTEADTTTHVTTVDSRGSVVTMTQTINNAFGARVIVPGTGLLLNNNMALFDPHPGMPNSVAPGRRIMSSMAPTIITRGERPIYALGTPGGVRIFPAILQAIINLIDHGMSLQEAVEAPRIWTQGQQLELEHGIPQATMDELSARGHEPVRVSTVAGGMNGVQLAPDGRMIGAACWRADGVPVGMGGGRAERGVDFRPTAD